MAGRCSHAYADPASDGNSAAERHTGAVPGAIHQDPGSIPAAHCHSNGNARLERHPDPLRADHPVPHTNPDSHPHGNRLYYRHAHQDSNANSNGNAHSHCHSNGNWHSNANAHTDHDPHSHCQSNGNWHSNANGNAN